MAWVNASYLEVVVPDLLCLLSSHSLFYKIICREIEVQERCAFIACKLFCLAFWTCMWSDAGGALQMPVYAVACEGVGPVLNVHSFQYASNVLLQVGALS